MSYSSEIVEVTADLKHETEKAYLLIFDGAHEVWVPKSQVEDHGDGTFTMPRWLADKNKLDYEEIEPDPGP
jgi:hypothetical protein